MNATRQLMLAVSGLLALAVTGHTANLAAQENEVRIGVLYPLTGPVAKGGNDVLNAAKTALDIVNNKHDLDLLLARTEGLPNLGGAKVRFIVADHQGKPEIGRAEAERLITSEKVHALYGAYHSSVTAAASNVAERLQIPYLTGESSSPKLHTRGFKWFFRAGPHDGHYTKTMFDFMRDYAKKTGIKIETVAIMHEDTQFGVDSARVQVELAEAAGLKVLLKMPYRSKTTSMIAEVQKLKAANADVYLPTSYTSDALLFMRTAKELNYQPKLFIAQNAGYSDNSFIEQMGKGANGIISRSPFSTDMVSKFPVLKAVNTIYRKYSGGHDIYEPIRSFVGAWILMEAINRAGSTDPMKIRQALRDTDLPATDIPMPWQGVKFGPDGQNNLVSTVLIQVHDGVYESIYPFNVAAREVTYPFPTWDSAR
jgi:branched-chain amino acid transport system substrate-binding protein